MIKIIVFRVVLFVERAAAARRFVFVVASQSKNEKKLMAATFKIDPVHIVISSKIQMLFDSTKLRYVFYKN